MLQWFNEKPLFANHVDNSEGGNPTMESFPGDK